MSSSDIYTHCLLRRRVTLPAHLQNKYAEDSILQNLRVEVEGVCGGSGYIRPRSVDVVDITPGVVDMSSLRGQAVYNVRYTADVCNPAVGDVLTCRVDNANPYGVLAVNTGDTRVVEVILPKQPVSFEHSESLDDLEPGDFVTLVVMSRQFKLGQKTITLIGRAVSKDHRPEGAEDGDDGSSIDPIDDGNDSGGEDSAEDDADDPDDPDDADDAPLATEPVSKFEETGGDDSAAEGSMHSDDDDDSAVDDSIAPSDEEVDE